MIEVQKKGTIQVTTGKLNKEEQANYNDVPNRKDTANYKDLTPDEVFIMISYCCTTFAAAGPLGPSTTSKVTRAPSSKDLNPSA